jgi:flagellum-specific ATP synthase
MFDNKILLEQLNNTIKETSTFQVSGKLTKVIGLVLESNGPKAPIGEVCVLRDRNGKEVCKSEIVGFKDENKILSMVLGELHDISPGMEIRALGEPLKINCSNQLLGRVLDGLGNPIDGKGDIKPEERRSIYASPPNPLLRQRISEPISTGVKAIYYMLTIGKGQRVGVIDWKWPRVDNKLGKEVAVIAVTTGRDSAPRQFTVFEKR